jgi:hypothetical protein
MSVDSKTPRQDMAATVWRWAQDLCQSASLSAADLAAAMGLDLATATTLGSQRIFTPPPPGSDHCEFVLDRDGRTVLFVDVTPGAPVSTDELSDLFGAGLEAPAGPHDLAPIVLFPPVSLSGALRACRMHARLRASVPQNSDVASVSLHPWNIESAD